MGTKQQDTGLILTGGGARGAYQAGVLQGIAEITSRRSDTLPFGIVSGASAGAINASLIASTADAFVAAAGQLANFWSELRSESIFRTDIRSLSRIGVSWATDLTLGNIRRTKHARSLLDTTPLRRLIMANIPFQSVQRHLDAGLISAFEVSALDYDNSENVSFIMSHQARANWVHPRRRSAYTAIKTEHVMASAAIPLIFPPVGIEGRYYGDGCVRNPAPFSPAIRLGAQRLLAVGVRHGRSHPAPETPQETTETPSVARILGVVLNAVLMDTVEYDIDRLSRMNKLVASVPPQYRENLPLKEIEFLAIQPSADLAEIASQHFRRLPAMIQYLIGGLGSQAEASELASYLLFEPAFCSYIAELGRQDALAKRDEIETFLFA
jgi:NTE family protein